MGTRLAVCNQYLRQKEILQLLLLMRQCNYSTISVYDSDLFNANIQLQLNGPNYRTHPADSSRAADSSLTFLVVLVRTGPGARPVLPIALGSCRLLLLGARTLAEVNALGQTRQVLGHGQRLQVRLSAIQAHLLDLLLAGRLDADPYSAHPRHSGSAGEAETPSQEPKIQMRTEVRPRYPGTGELQSLCWPPEKQTLTLNRKGSREHSNFPRMHCNALQNPPCAPISRNPVGEAPAQWPSGPVLPICEHPDRQCFKLCVRELSKMKERILEAARDKGTVTYKGVPIRLSADFSKET
ncbi:uncharacterized protein LOC128628177 [Artibeus jamaicensis]|uniref:uncharacterized protein LOC128628177 n=1 Tax=Artibeus jamaicensis TaxID=9417 RepID=UPI00235A75EF|nr:uncharacterized protein LOC128628177 [Artibeus jamaicensis]